jgi:deoxyribonuclease-4
MRLGAHISVAGGVSKAFSRAQEVTADCMQIFTRNQRQWVPKPLPSDEVSAFLQLREETGIGPNMSHASYLVNLATHQEELEAKSIAAMVDEVRRADALGLEFVVFHPGSTPDGLEVGIDRVARRLDRIIETVGDASHAIILLENTAGQGNTLGLEFSHLRDVLAATSYPDRLGVCIDTCHAFAAGYDYTSEDGYHDVVERLLAAVTLPKVQAFHINDSLKELASRRDRHAGIGEGHIGLEPLARWLNDPRFQDLPATLETPEAEARYKEELTLLRGLMKG